MKKITNKRYADIEKRFESLEKKVNRLQSLGDKLTDEIEELFQTVRDDEGNLFEELIDAIEAEKGELYDELNEIAGDADCYYDDRTESWQESDKGEVYSEWKNRLIEFADTFNETDLFVIEVEDTDIKQGELKICVNIDDEVVEPDLENEFPQQPE